MLFFLQYSVHDASYVSFQEGGRLARMEPNTGGVSPGGSTPPTEGEFHPHARDHTPHRRTHHKRWAWDSLVLHKS